MADKLKATLSAGMALKASLTAGTSTQTIEVVEKDYNNLSLLSLLVSFL